MLQNSQAALTAAGIGVMVGFIPGYCSAIVGADSQKRYSEKLEMVNGNGIDPHEVARSDWAHNVDLWPDITAVHVCMYLVVTPSPYTDKDLLNYKSWIAINVLYMDELTVRYLSLTLSPHPSDIITDTSLMHAFPYTARKRNNIIHVHY